MNETDRTKKGLRELPFDQYENDIHASRIVQIPSNQQMRVAYDANQNPEYVGIAARGLVEAKKGWLLQKITWDGNNNPTKIQIAYDSWNNYTTATYA